MGILKFNYYGGTIGDFKFSKTDQNYNLTNQAATPKGYWTTKPSLDQGSFTFNPDNNDGSFRFYSSNGDNKTNNSFWIKNIEAPTLSGHRELTVSIAGVMKKRDNGSYDTTFAHNGFLKVYCENTEIGEIFFCHISDSQIRVMKQTGAKSSKRSTVNDIGNNYWGAVSATLNLDNWHSIKWTLKNDGTQEWKIDNNKEIIQSWPIDKNSLNISDIWNLNKAVNTFKFEYTAPTSAHNAARYTRIKTPITVTRDPGPVGLEFGKDDGTMYTKTHDPNNRADTREGITDNTTIFKAFEFN